MSETVVLVTSVIGLFLAIIAHVVASVWWASAITTTLRFNTLELKRITETIDGHGKQFYEKDSAKEQILKRDKEVADIWAEVARIREKVSILEGDRRAQQKS